MVSRSDATRGPVPKYLEHVTSRQKDRANILKQHRLHREELDKERKGRMDPKGQGKDKDRTDPTPKKKGKKGKKQEGQPGEAGVEEDE